MKEIVSYFIIPKNVLERHPIKKICDFTNYLNFQKGFIFQDIIYENNEEQYIYMFRSKEDLRKAIIDLSQIFGYLGIERETI